MMDVTGIDGQISFDGEYVTIVRLGQLAEAGMRLHITQIRGTQITPPGDTGNGCIQLTMRGSHPVAEIRVLFSRSQMDDFTVLYVAISGAVSGLVLNPKTPLHRGSVQGG